MQLSEIIKKQPFFKEIESRKENFPASMLFFCEDEQMAKTTLTLVALMLSFPAYQLLDEGTAQFKRIAGGADLDVKVYPKNGEKLLVADSSEIVAESYIRPVNLPRKIFLISNFDVSTDEAQNKLLKVIEEPPKDVIFLLSAKEELRVLPTIKSRCEKVQIPPLSAEEMQKLGFGELAIRLGKGFVGKTQSLSQNENLSAVTNFAISLFTDMKNSKQVLSFSKKFVDFKDDIGTILQVMCFCIEDLIKIKCDSENLCTLSASRLKDVEPEFSVHALCEISSLIGAFRQKLEFNGNINLAVDSLLLKMLEVKFLCK